VVKFAEASKDQKKQRNGTISPVMHSLCTTPVSALQSCLTGAPLLDNSYLNLLKAQQQQLMSLALPAQQYMTPEVAYSTNAPLLLGGNKLPLLPNQILTAPSPTSKLITPDALSLASLSTLASIPHSYTALSPIAKISSAAANSKQIEGPNGANLFIYHLPGKILTNHKSIAFSNISYLISFSGIYRR